MFDVNHNGQCRPGWSPRSTTRLAACTVIRASTRLDVTNGPGGATVLNNVIGLRQPGDADLNDGTVTPALRHLHDQVFANTQRHHRRVAPFPLRRNAARATRPRPVAVLDRSPPPTVSGGGGHVAIDLARNLSASRRSCIVWAGAHDFCRRKLTFTITKAGSTMCLAVPSVETGCGVGQPRAWARRPRRH